MSRVFELLDLLSISVSLHSPSSSHCSAFSLFCIFNSHWRVSSSLQPPPLFHLTSTGGIWMRDHIQAIVIFFSEVCLLNTRMLCFCVISWDYTVLEYVHFVPGCMYLTSVCPELCCVCTKFCDHYLLPSLPIRLALFYSTTYIHSFIHPFYSLSYESHSLLQSEFSKQCEPVFHVSISSNPSFP